MGVSWKRRVVAGVLATAGASGGLLLGAAAPAMAVPVVNNGFELPEIEGTGGDQLFGTGSTIGGGWVVATGSVDVVEEGGANPANSWEDAEGNEGDQSLDLNGSDPGSICQSFATAADAEYVLSFDISHNGAAENSLGEAEVYINGFLHGSFEHSGPSVQAQGEASYEATTLSFHTDSTNTTICFVSSDWDDPRTGAVLDDIHLNGAPTATIVTPSQFAVYYQGQDVQYDFECSDPDGDLVSCEGEDEGIDVADGADIDTSTVGVRSVSLYSEDPSGQSASDHATYQVVPVLSGCRGTGAILLNSAIGQANPPIVPCAGGLRQLAQVTQVIGFPMPSFLSFLNSTLVATAVTGSTVSTPGAYVANGSVAAVRLNIPSLALTLNLTGIHSSAQASLNGCDSTTVTGQSRIATLQINGKNTLLAQGESFIPLPGLGGIRINQKVVTGTTIVQRAFSLDLPGTALDVVLGESIAGAQCAPPAVILD